MHITTSGESHGKGLFAILEGIPAGLELDLNAIDEALRIRQSGYGRGARQSIEHDRAEILSGVRDRVTLGSPITIAVWNRDFESWKEVMAPEGCDRSARRVTAVRPGHADLAGMQKFRTDDARNILERASARETVARVAAGEICRMLLRALGVEIVSFVRSVGEVVDAREYLFSQIVQKKLPELGMMDPVLQKKAMEEIDVAKAAGDTLGGTVRLLVHGLKSGFGSCMTYREKLDGRLAGALMSVQAIKGVEVGHGFALASLHGSAAHDEIYPQNGKYVRLTNRAGGIEGGMSNGEELVLTAAMKPIPTLMSGLATVDTATGKEARAARERSDVCAVTACAAVLEAALASELCAVVLERLGGDTLSEVKSRYLELP